MPKKATANKTKPKKSTAKKTSPVTSAAKTVAAKAEPTQKNLDIYGAKPLLWSRAVKQLEAGPPGGTFWLATTKPDGRPHVAGVGALWVDGKVYFVSGAGTRKSRNLAQNANCVISMSLTGIDLVVEGVAERVTDDQTLQRLAKRGAFAPRGAPVLQRRGLKAPPPPGGNHGGGFDGGQRERCLACDGRIRAGGADEQTRDGRRVSASNGTSRRSGRISQTRSARSPRD